MGSGATAIPFVDSRPPAWASGYGQDEFGYFAEFSVSTGPQYWDLITQRMRWIPPGTFLMGAMDSEPTFIDSETQHEVTLSRGYWLADTACTQELWQELTAKTPSHFEGADRPVEQVSFAEVAEFLDQLNQRVSDGAFALPTEAQWEYACRAGTTTPFSFGDTIHTDQVNYDGNHPYADSPQGVYREETVGVKELPANAWGLYQMHGNVWEWCSDWYAEYPAESQSDPVGPERGSSRVVRGGSWYSNARDVRSACRLWYDPGHRYVNLGFRILSSAGPDTGGPPIK